MRWLIQEKSPYPSEVWEPVTDPEKIVAFDRELAASVVFPSFSAAAAVAEPVEFASFGQVPVACCPDSSVCHLLPSFYNKISMGIRLGS